MRQARGNDTANVVPTPTLLATVIFSLCASTTHLVIILVSLIAAMVHLIRQFVLSFVEEMVRDQARDRAGAGLVKVCVIVEPLGLVVHRA